MEGAAGHVSAWASEPDLPELESWLLHPWATGQCPVLSGPVPSSVKSGCGGTCLTESWKESRSKVPQAGSEPLRTVGVSPPPSEPPAMPFLLLRPSRHLRPSGNAASCMQPTSASPELGGLPSSARPAGLLPAPLDGMARAGQTASSWRGTGVPQHPHSTLALTLGGGGARCAGGLSSL